jgi:hypothetical protein
MVIVLKPRSVSRLESKSIVLLSRNASIEKRINEKLQIINNTTDEINECKTTIKILQNELKTINKLKYEIKNLKVKCKDMILHNKLRLMQF